MIENILRIEPSEIISSTRLKHLLQAALGAFLIAVYSQLEIPIQPVPITMQTLAIFLLGMTQGGRLAMHSVLFYLVAATIGLPVLAGGMANPYWFCGPRAGYLISFLISAYVMGKLEEKNQEQKIFSSCMHLLIGQLIMWVIGSSWLAMFIGMKKAILLGLIPFVPGSAVKIILALFAKKPFKKVFTQYDW